MANGDAVACDHGLPNRPIDPLERRNLVADEPNTVARLRAILDRYPAQAPRR